MLDELIGRLARAERPTLIAGPSVLRGLCGQAVRNLSELTGLGVVPIDSPVGLAEPSLHRLGRALAESDLIILAARPDFAVNFLDEQRVRPGTTSVQVADDPAVFGQNRASRFMLLADASTAFTELFDTARALMSRGESR